jgi:hypothetical protein
MPSSYGKVWYINNTTNKIYRLDGFGYTMDTNEKYILLKEIDNGARWVMPASDLHKECLLDGRPIKLWEEMPDGWHPIGEEKRYPGYTNDPRKDVEQHDYDEDDGRDSYRRPSIGYSNRRYIGFRGR